MPNTAFDLRTMALFASRYGIHTGDHFATRTAGGMAILDICGLAYIATEGCEPPHEFFTDEVASLRLIEASAPAMQAIRAISGALDSQPCVTEIAPGVEVPDYIEHVSNWAATAPIGATEPPTLNEVIGRILRAASALTPDPAAAQELAA